MASFRLYIERNIQNDRKSSRILSRISNLTFNYYTRHDAETKRCKFFLFSGKWNRFGEHPRLFNRSQPPIILYPTFIHRAKSRIIGPNSDFHRRTIFRVPCYTLIIPVSLLSSSPYFFLHIYPLSSLPSLPFPFSSSFFFFTN